MLLMKSEVWYTLSNIIEQCIGRHTDRHDYIRMVHFNDIYTLVETHKRKLERYVELLGDVFS